MSVIDYSWDFSKEEFSLDLDFFNEKEQEDKLWQARTGLDYESLCGAIETIIFMQDRPINLLKIKNQIDSDLPLRVVHESIARLQVRTKATYSKIVQNMFKVQSLQLSPTALEVLAIIAYKQPISRTAVDSIRGVDSSHIIRALMDRRLVKIAGRSDEVGRPSLYATTAEFLEVFNLNSIDDLPSEIELEEIANANEIGQISDIKNIVNTGDKKKFDMDELLELDQLSSSIQEIASDTTFTKSLKEMDKVRKTDEGVEKKSAFDILEEFVSKAQIIEQNKSSAGSETLTSVMEPKPISLKLLKDMLFNTPELENDEEEVQKLTDLSEANFQELDSDSVKDIEARADEVFEKSEKLIDSLQQESALSEIGESHNLSDEIDAAFANLMEEQQDEPQQEITTSADNDDLDISSFIADKLALAQDEASAKSEEDELSEALDQAFANLTNEDVVQEVDQAIQNSEELADNAIEAAKEFDIDLGFLDENEQNNASDEQRE